MSRFSVLVFLSLCSVALSGVVSSYPDPELPGGLFRRVAAYEAAQFDGQKVAILAPIHNCSVASLIGLYFARVGAEVKIFAPQTSKLCTSILADAAVKETGGKCTSATLDYTKYDDVLAALNTFGSPIYTIVNIPGVPAMTALAAESAYVAGCDKCKDIPHPSVVQLYHVESTPEIENAADTAVAIALMRNAVGHGVRANSMRIKDMGSEEEVMQVAESILYLSADESKHVRGTMFNRHWSFY